ncbi:hypothetical protein DFJ73DRAFT_815907 [Zopfochytrium polystomum]|nr:hypothetical protein DFJ73DRAFT_815907 [Zopfochytrium polystomum]
MQSLCCAQVYHVGCMFQWIKDKRRCPTCRCGMPIKPPYPPPPAHAVFAVKGCQTTRRACQRNVGVGTADEDSMTDCAMSLATTAAEGPAGEAGLGSEAQPLAAALLPSRIALPLMGAALPFVVSVALLCLLWTALDSREALTSMEVAVA